MSPTKREPRRVKLTELAVLKAQPQAAAYVIWDTLQRGLALRVQPTGRKSWYCVYSRRNRVRWLHLGDANAIGLADARILAAKAALAVAMGGDPAADKKAERGAGTFAELHTRYLEEHAKRHNKSWKQADALIRRHVLPRWGKLKAATVTRGDVKAMMAKIAAPIVANKTLAALSAVYTWGLKEEIVTGNPCKLVPRNPAGERERVLADSEIAPFWHALDDIDRMSGAALRTLLLTGQRPGEVACMRREHIRDGWWTMPGKPVPELGWPGTKNAATHRVWLPQAAQALIAELAEEGTSGGFVFHGPRGGPARDLDGAMRKISRKLGLAEPARPHDLRRTHGTTITKLKFGRDAMNRIQNHIEGGIADIYDQHGYEEENRHVMETVAARIMTLAAERADDGKIVQMIR
jgi:integrase